MSKNPANQSGDSSQDLLQETPATTNDAATTVAPTIAADANTASVNIPVADATSTTTAVTDGAAPTTNAATVDTNSDQAAPNVQMCNQLQLIRMLQLQIQLTILQQPLQTVQQQRIRKIQKPIHVVVVPWQKLVKPTPNTSTGIQWINGKQYYVNSDGSVRKNFVFEQDGKSYYF